jgi:hypothetical protein
MLENIINTISYVLSCNCNLEMAEKFRSWRGREMPVLSCHKQMPYYGEPWEVEVKPDQVNFVRIMKEHYLSLAQHLQLQMT